MSLAKIAKLYQTNFSWQDWQDCVSYKELMKKVIEKFPQASVLISVVVRKLPL